MRAWLTRLGLAFALALAIAIAIGWTPDMDRAEMIARYGGDLARWAEGEAGLKIHYRDQGDPQGPALLLVHGSNASLHTWEPWVARLGDAVRIVSLDLPGHALTGPHPRRDYSARAMIAAVDAVVAAAGLERFAIAGNSMGGWVAWRYALAHPERLTHLVLVDAAGAPVRAQGGLPIGFRIARMPGVNTIAARITPRWLVERTFRQSVANQAIVTPDAIDRYWRLLRFPGNRRAALDRMSTDREDQAFARIGEIATPTLILWGREDRLIPVEAARAFARRMPDATVIVYDRIGHVPMEEAADRSAADVRAFLTARR